MGVEVVAAAGIDMRVAAGAGHGRREPRRGAWAARGMGRVWAGRGYWRRGPGHDLAELRSVPAEGPPRTGDPSAPADVRLDFRCS